MKEVEYARDRGFFWEGVGGEKEGIKCPAWGRGAEENRIHVAGSQGTEEGTAHTQELEVEVLVGRCNVGRWGGEAPHGGVKSICPMSKYQNRIPSNFLWEVG
jgi:hypothetical protein